VSVAWTPGVASGAHVAPLSTRHPPPPFLLSFRSTTRTAVPRSSIPPAPLTSLYRASLPFPAARRAASSAAAEESRVLRRRRPPLLSNASAFVELVFRSLPLVSYVAVVTRNAAATRSSFYLPLSVDRVDTFCSVTPGVFAERVLLVIERREIRRVFGDRESCCSRARRPSLARIRSRRGKQGDGRTERVNIVKRRARLKVISKCVA